MKLKLRKFLTRHARSLRRLFVFFLVLMLFLWIKQPAFAENNYKFILYIKEGKPVHTVLQSLPLEELRQILSKREKETELEKLGVFKTLNQRFKDTRTITMSDLEDFSRWRNLVNKKSMLLKASLKAKELSKETKLYKARLATWGLFLWLASNH